MMNTLQDPEEIVFNTIQKYLDENKVVDNHNLINYIKSRFAKSSVNINEAGIIQILESLIKKKRIVLGSKLSQEFVLNNENRRQIYSYILQNPCANFYKIVNMTALSNHVVVWHLVMLQKFNFVKKINFGRRELYYDARIRQEEAMSHFFKMKRISRLIIEHLAENKEGCNKTQLAESLQLHPKTVSKYVSYLDEFGLLEKQQLSKNEIIYFLK